MLLFVCLYKVCDCANIYSKLHCYVSATDTSVFDDIAEILQPLPALEIEEQRIETDNFRCSCRHYTMNFLLARHTKLSFDWCFGLIKRTFRRTKVDCHQYIAQVVANSSTVGINVARLLGHEDDTVLVPMHDRSTFLGQHF